MISTVKSPLVSQIN